MHQIPGNPIPKGYQQLTGLNAVKQLTVPVGANYAVIRCTGQDIRWRDDGVAPTAGVGMPLAVGEELHYDAPTGLVNLRFIEQAASAEISINYYGA
jgi:hypothetical protein